MYCHVVCVTIDGVWIGEWIYWPLIHAPRDCKKLQHHSLSPQHPLSPFQPVVSSPDVPWQRLLTVKILQLHELRFDLHSLPYRNVWQLSLSLMLRPTVSRPVCLGIKHPYEAYDQIFITVRLLLVCWCGALSLTKGLVWLLQLLLSLASSVILGSESRGTRQHILLSQIRLEGLRGK
jgi:hypothetical protein